MAHNLLVLAAGYATRMGTLTDTCPKPLLEVAGRPMMDWVLERLGGIPGTDRITVVSNAKFIGQFQAWQANHCGRVGLVDNGSSGLHDRRGAVGDLQFALQAANLWEQDLLVVGGDNLFEFPPLGFVEFSRDKPAVIGTYDVGSPEEVKRFASVESDSSGLITAFEEKPPAPRNTTAGIALYFFQRAVLPLVAQYLAEGRNPDQAGHLIAWLRGQVATYACPIAGRWFDVGSIDSLAEAGRVFASLAARDSGCVDRGSRT